MEATRNSNVEILGVLGDAFDAPEVEYQFLVDGKHIKYITMTAAAHPNRLMAPEEVFLPWLPEFPPGDWNDGYIDEDKDTGNPVFTFTRKICFQSVRNRWHPTIIDFSEFDIVEKKTSNVFKARHPELGRSSVIIKFAQFPWQTPAIENETKMYQIIQDRGIAPKFLGHLTDCGRVFGFILEYIPYPIRAAPGVPGDWEACRKTIADLHALGIRHGGLNQRDFIMHRKKAYLIDFKRARPSCMRGLSMEYQKIESELTAPREE